MGKDPSLKRTMFWAFVMSWGRQGLGNAVSLVLAAILGPKEFGTVSIAVVFLSFVQVISSQGMEDALIQRQDLEDDHLNSSFWMMMGCSVLLVGVSMLASNWWAGLNHQPLVATVMCVLALRIPVAILMIVPRAIMTRQLDFKASAFQWNVSEALGGVVGIGMASTGWGLWSLVGQQMGRDLSMLLMIWRHTRWMPKMRFSNRHLKEVLSFSVPAFFAELGSMVYNQVDTLLIGLFFGDIAVGLYRLADRIRLSILTVVTKAIQWVSLPNLSKFQNEPEKLKATYLALLRVSVAATGPVMIGLATASELLVNTLGAKWAMAASAISILCVMGSMESFTFQTIPLLQAKGRPRALAVLIWAFGVVNTVVIVLCGLSLREAAIIPQLNGVALAKLAVFSIGFVPINLVMSKNTAGTSYREIGRAVLSGVVASVACWAIVSVLKTWVIPRTLPAPIALAVVLSVAFSTSLGLVLWMEKEWRLNLFGFVARRLKLAGG